jgi:phosphoribosylanthranilate isomerase
MALNTIVKVGNISNLSDARYCAGMGVQYLGFSLDSHKADYVDPLTLKSIKEWVVGPEIVGELSGLDHVSIQRTAERYDIDCLEVAHPGVLDGLTTFKLPLILKLDISAFQNTGELREIMTFTADKVIYFILERSAGSTIQVEEILGLAVHFKIMTGFSIHKDSLHSWLDGTKIYGVSLKGETETIPGFKDYDALAEILEALDSE